MKLGWRKFQWNIPKWLIPAIGYVISIACLIWVFRGVDFPTMWEDFQSMHWRWVILAVGCDIAVYVYQAWRWNLLLSPVVRVPLWRSVQAIYVGLFSNEVLPLRPGEVIRSYLQARWNEIPFSVAFSSAIIERIFDGIWLMAVFVLTTVLLPLPRMLIDIGKVVGAIVLAFSFFLCLVMFWKHHAHAAVPKTRWGAKLRILIDDLHLMGRSKSFYAAAAASLPYLLIQVVPVYALIRGYDLDLSWWPAMVVLVVLRLATALPQLPGNLGASNASIVVALGLFGVDKTTATGLSLMTWGVITAPLVIAGFIALAITDSSLRDLKRHAHSHFAAPVVASGPRTTKSL